MSDETSFAGVDEQYVELLAARTLLSMLSAVDLGTGGTPGTPGPPGLGVPSTGITWLPISNSTAGAGGGAGTA
ncbi:MAG: hypothetical protein ACRDSR_09495 [Pseudonocardiaceae bacterium]